jgi:hypothetical protein
LILCSRRFFALVENSVNDVNDTAANQQNEDTLNGLPDVVFKYLTGKYSPYTEYSQQSNDDHNTGEYHGKKVSHFDHGSIELSCEDA